MFWIILFTVLFIILFGTIKAEIYTVVRKRTFYVVKLTFCGIKVYGMAVCIRVKKSVNVQVLSIKRGGYQVLSDLETVVKNSMEKLDDQKIIVIKKILRAIRLEKARADITLGVDDAAATALLCGALTSSLNTLARIKHLENATINTRANFEKKEFSVHINCILSVFFAQIIYEFIKQKGGSKRCTR